MYNVEYQSGQSRMNPGTCIDYMLVTVDSVELYAEAVNQTWDEEMECYTDESATYDELKAEIINQAEVHGISVDQLRFWYNE